MQKLTACLLLVLSLITPGFSTEEWTEEYKNDDSQGCWQPKKVLFDELEDDNEYEIYKTAFATASQEIKDSLDSAYEHIIDLHTHQIPSPADAFEILNHNIETTFINLKGKIPFLKANEPIQRAYTTMKERINHASQSLRYNQTINELNEDFDLLKFNMDEVFLSLKENQWEFQQL